MVGRHWRSGIWSQFWARVERRGDDECWNYVGGLSKKGYGQGWFNLDRVYRTAHRASWAIHFGPPGDLCVCHRCDNRRCVNPAHLFLGTNAENMADMAAKGRGQRGQTHVKARLTDDTVRAIRVASGTTAEIARRFGVSHGTVRAVLTGRTWKHVK